MRRVAKGEKGGELGLERDSVGCYVDEQVLGLCAEGHEGLEERCHFCRSKKIRSG